MGGVFASMEVATGDLVPLKITQVFGGGLGSRSAGEMPRTVENEDRPLSMQLRLPVSVDHAYVAFTSYLAGAAHVFNPDVVERLLDAIIGLLRLVPAVSAASRRSPPVRPPPVPGRRPRTRPRS
ncbi:hypothetical protein SAMN05660733_07018 [Lentzea albidocapillata]|uniref:Uncharacterized protein n=1 Tax=Lentzea albidocapillata TaxID=40571 RepID=A0A1W2FMH4_9PSEU|nr:hypothetical protein SAMN05660733_07018 [Lentzea albidocapillata]